MYVGGTSACSKMYYKAPIILNEWYNSDTPTNPTEQKSHEANHKDLVHDISSISKSTGENIQ